jgi:hypothetical protein
LAIRLSASASDLAATFGGCGPSATFSELPFNNFIEEVFTDFSAENSVVDLDLIELFSVLVNYFKVSHCKSIP